MAEMMENVVLNIIALSHNPEDHLHFKEYISLLIFKINLVLFGNRFLSEEAL